MHYPKLKELTAPRPSGNGYSRANKHYLRWHFASSSALGRYTHNLKIKCQEYRIYSRKSLREIFPTAVLGKESQNTMVVGRL